jgi:hypothetical protein
MKSLFVASLFLAAACATTPTTPQQGPTTHVCAQWVDQPDAYFGAKKQKVLAGVGSASNIPDVSLRRTAAEADARAKLAVSFKNNIENLVKSYRSVVAGGEKSAFEMHVTDVTRTFTNMTLHGVRVAERCFAPDVNTEFVLATIDAEAFKESLGRMKGLSAELQKAIRENSKKAFEEMDVQRDRGK